MRRSVFSDWGCGGGVLGRIGGGGEEGWKRKRKMEGGCRGCSVGARRVRVSYCGVGMIGFFR